MHTVIRLLLGVFYRPNDLLNMIEDRWSYAWLGIGIAIVVAGSSVFLAYSILVLSLIPIELVAIASTLPIVAISLATIPFMLTFARPTRRPLSLMIFWFIVTEIMITPFLIVGFIIFVLWVPAAEKSLSNTQTAVLYIFVGIALGKALSTALSLYPQSRRSIDWRWFVVIGFPTLAITLWLIPQTRSTPEAPHELVFLGAAAGQFRIGAWVWQALWAVALLVVAAITGRFRRASTFFPASLDQLRLLPLPGTTTMLRRQSHVSAYETARWITQLASQPIDRWLTKRFIVNLPQEPPAFAILFWLSLDPVGQALLRSLCESRAPLSVMVQSYAQLSRVLEPGAWRLALEHYAQALTAAPAPRHITWLPQLIASAQIILEARRWEHVQQGIAALDHAGTATGNTIEEKLSVLREQIQETLSDQVETPMYETWPLRLLDTLTEQLVFLKAVA